MRCGTAFWTEVNFDNRLVFVAPRVRLRRAYNFYFSWIEIAPSGATFSAKRTITFIDVFWTLSDAKLCKAAHTGQLKHPLVSKNTPG
jgi:hypothetical protein